MGSNINGQIRDIQLFLMTQFIDVIDVIDKYEKIEEVKDDIKNRKKIYLKYINEMSKSKEPITKIYNENINVKIEKCKEIYSTNIEYKKILKEMQTKYKELEKDLEQRNKNKLEKIKELIYELCDFDVHIAYKIGLVDGLKTKNILN